MTCEHITSKKSVILHFKGGVMSDNQQELKAAGETMITIQQNINTFNDSNDNQLRSKLLEQILESRFIRKAFIDGAQHSIIRSSEIKPDEEKREFLSAIRISNEQPAIEIVAKTNDDWKTKESLPFENIFLRTRNVPGTLAVKDLVLQYN